MKFQIAVSRIAIPDGQEYSRSSYPHEGVFIVKPGSFTEGYSILSLVTNSVIALTIQDAFLDEHFKPQEDAASLAPSMGVSESTLLKTIALLTNKSCEEVKF